MTNLITMKNYGHNNRLAHRNSASVPVMKRNSVNWVLAVALGMGLGPGDTMAQNLELTDENNQSTSIPLADPSTVTIDPVTGDVIAKPQIDTAAWNACLGAGACMVEIGTFTVEPSSVTQGGTIQFTWDARGAWDCVGTMEDAAGNPVTSTTWDDSTSRLPEDSASVGTSTLDPGDYVAFIECRNPPDAPPLATSQVPFTVTDPNPDAPAFCSDQGRVPPSGMTQDQAMLWSNDVPSQPLDNQTVTWKQFFFSDFPRGETTSFEILQDHYGALAFETGTTPVGTGGQITFEIPQFAQGALEPGDKLVTISQCPGDFTTLMDDPECRKVIANSDIRWKIGSSIETDFQCTLLQNTTYFLNIIYTPDADASPLQWGCTGGDSLDDRCGNRADHLD